MPDGVRSEVLSRISTVREFLRWTSQHDSTASAFFAATRAAKGMIFVQNYAAYEFALTSSVKALLSHLNSFSTSVGLIRPELLALVLEPEFASVIDGATRRTWENRIHLLRRARCAAPVVIHDGLFPKDGSQFRPSQLDLLWELFGFPEPVLPDPRLRYTITEMVDNRNRIAHGSETPENVGCRYTIADLEMRIDATEQICTHLTTTFVQYLAGPAPFR